MNISCLCMNVERNIKKVGTLRNTSQPSLMELISTSAWAWPGFSLYTHIQFNLRLGFRLRLGLDSRFGSGSGLDLGVDWIGLRPDLGQTQLSSGPRQLTSVSEFSIVLMYSTY